MKMDNKILEGFEYAKKVYKDAGIDVDAAISLVDEIPVSMHCWQGDDVIGFEGEGVLTGGIAATGNYPGRARNAEELRSDIDKAISLIPGCIRLNLHASYAELNGSKVDRDEYTIEHFKNWVEWAKNRNIGLDFNPTFFSHPKMDGNLTLSSRNKSIRKFWIEHGKRCREIASEFSKRLGTPSVVDFWMPDGYKDIPADTRYLRELMKESLDEIFSAKVNGGPIIDAIESKLFGIGVESYTVASHEFSYGYAISRKIAYCLDAGHFHPTEVISGKISAALEYLNELLLHISRGVRWDSDHVVTYDDELQNIVNEIIFNSYIDRVHIALDYFDASINRIACWVIGMRNVRKALLRAALTPIKEIREAEAKGDFTSRLALFEEAKNLPFAAVWDYYCLSKGVPVGKDWLDIIKDYEQKVLSRR